MADVNIPDEVGCLCAIDQSIGREEEGEGRGGEGEEEVSYHACKMMSHFPLLQHGDSPLMLAINKGNLAVFDMLMDLRTEEGGLLVDVTYRNAEVRSDHLFLSYFHVVIDRLPDEKRRTTTLPSCGHRLWATLTCSISFWL